VVALNRGSVPEVLQHGITGIIADDFDGFCLGLDAARELDGAACRADAVARFDIPTMSDAYSRAYAKVIDRSEAPAREATRAITRLVHTVPETRVS
jgi:hypothetical protein